MKIEEAIKHLTPQQLQDLANQPPDEKNFVKNNHWMTSNIRKAFREFFLSVNSHLVDDFPNATEERMTNRLTDYFQLTGIHYDKLLFLNTLFSQAYEEGIVAMRLEETKRSVEKTLGFDMLVRLRIKLPFLEVINDVIVQCKKLYPNREPGKYFYKSKYGDITGDAAKFLHHQDQAQKMLAHYPHAYYLFYNPLKAYEDKFARNPTSIQSVFMPADTVLREKQEFFSLEQVYTSAIPFSEFFVDYLLKGIPGKQYPGKGVDGQIGEPRFVWMIDVSAKELGRDADMRRVEDVIESGLKRGEELLERYVKKTKASKETRQERPKGITRSR